MDKEYRPKEDKRWAMSALELHAKLMAKCNEIDEKWARLQKLMARCSKARKEDKPPANEEH